ncbi:hypothetical protein JW899_04175 [Candidatus Uhrbacteria bacterium]|nr:hypothetical protein [Candidatus Uhrbacteria bacterium]
MEDIQTKNDPNSDGQPQAPLAGDGGHAVLDQKQETVAPTDGQVGENRDVSERSADQNRMRVIVKALKNIERDIANVIRLLEGGSGVSNRETALMAVSSLTNRLPAVREDLPTDQSVSEGRVVEGVFDGQNMVGSDGKIYTVPANYASKSKLVEGDMLKLTITARGSFIYKQIGPIERVRVMAVLGFDPTIGEYYATDETRRWSILKASVTYYRGDVGDEIVLLVPKSTPSRWAAVENVIKKNPLDGNVAVMPAEGEAVSSVPFAPAPEPPVSEGPVPFGNEN